MADTTTIQNIIVLKEKLVLDSRDNSFTGLWYGGKCWTGRLCQEVCDNQFHEIDLIHGAQVYCNTCRGESPYCSVDHHDNSKSQNRKKFESKDGLPWKGEAKWVFSDGSYFDGEWHNGRRLHGIGKVVYSKDSYYIGQWRNGKRCDGLADIVYRDKNCEKGEFRNGKLWNGTVAIKNSYGYSFKGEKRCGKQWNGEETVIDYGDSKIDIVWQDGVEISRRTRRSTDDFSKKKRIDQENPNDSAKKKQKCRDSQ